MLRGAAMALLAANLLFFAWTRGWLDPVWPAPAHGEREPGRQAAQVKPELINVLSARAAGAAVAAAQAASMAAGATEVCLEAGPFSTLEAEGAEAALEQAGVPRGSWERRAAPASASATAADRVMLGIDRPSEALRKKLQALPVAAPRFVACEASR